MTQQLQRRTETAVTLRSLAESPAYKTRFQEVLRDRAPQFVASLVQLVNASQQLQSCEPNTVMAAAITAAALDLPIEKNLGFAYIVPYGQQAQFQIGYRGLVQLAIRTAQYKFLNVTPVYEGELDFHNPLTSEIVLKTENRKSEKIIGYAAYFRLTNGFEHAEYWPTKTVEDHARRYSQAYKAGRETPWKTDFDKMAMKTVLKSMLSHWGILSVEMQQAITDDEGVKTAAGEVFYPDNVDPVKAPQFDGPARIPESTIQEPHPEPEKRRGRPPKEKSEPEPSPSQTAPPATPEPAKSQASPAAADADPFAEPEAVKEGAAAAPLVPGQEPAEVGQLRELMKKHGIIDKQVLSFCPAKKLFREDGQPAVTLSELAGTATWKGRIAMLIKNLSNEDGPAAAAIKAEPV